MTRPAAISALLSAACASALLGGCAAFNLGPETDAARAANEAVRGYPRLSDVPPEPVDVHCLRAAIGAPTPRAPQTLEGDRGPYGDVVSAMRAASALATGGEDDEDEAETAAPRRVPCPPMAGDEAERLVADRERLEQTAQDMRDARPAAPGDADSITLPEDMGAVAAAGQGPEAAR